MSGLSTECYVQHSINTLLNNRGLNYDCLVRCITAIERFKFKLDCENHKVSLSAQIAEKILV